MNLHGHLIVQTRYHAVADSYKLSYLKSLIGPSVSTKHHSRPSKRLLRVFPTLSFSLIFLTRLLVCSFYFFCRI